MIYSFAEFLWIFFVYSFIGWVLESIVSDIKNRKLVNRGLVNGPFCVIYGFAAVAISFGLHELHGFWLFLISAVIATVVEWIGGHVIESMYHERWWDYSGIKYNLDGYICLPVSILWGIFGWVGITFGNKFFIFLFELVPDIVGIIVVWALMSVLLLDLFATVYILSGRTKMADQMIKADEWLSGISSTLSRAICKQVDKRIKKAYPKAVYNDKVAKKKEKSSVFAEGCSFYKIFLLFVIGSFLGDLTETIFCRLTAGVWMSRSSLVWGPFSVVWGLAIALVTWMLYKYKDYSSSFMFCIGTLLGGSYEYLCSVFTEIFFGKIFWDYSGMRFNLGGRINLLYCFFWGIAAVVWFKVLYPKVSKWIEKIPKKQGTIITWVLVVFMVCNVVVSGLALIRYDKRSKGEMPYGAVGELLDERFPDLRMEKIYPNAKSVE